MITVHVSDITLYCSHGQFSAWQTGKFVNYLYFFMECNICTKNYLAFYLKSECLYVEYEGCSEKEQTDHLTWNLNLNSCNVIRKLWVSCSLNVNTEIYLFTYKKKGSIDQHAPLYTLFIYMGKYFSTIRTYTINVKLKNLWI